ncbi:hypothetical protein BJV82DRAFT_663450 [Fennellomyces sp. T-0311]|nr:hypothetical protein BJV82DRAFT_663450 [Fennellomyces sp. T-0311]
MADVQYLAFGFNPAAWDQVTLPTRTALENGHYDDAIHCSTQVVENLLRGAAAVLALRSQAWARKADIVQEIHDALLITEYDPRSVDGYLRASRLYTTQGQQSQAIDILEEGMRLVPPSDPRFGLLENQLSLAEAQRKRRVDFISSCPYDILCNIAGFLEADSLYECVNVCRSWRIRILQCADRWKKLDLDHSNNDRLEFAATALLPVVSQHVKQLRLERIKPRSLNSYLKIMSTGDFPNLQSLKINEIFYRGSRYSSVCESICNVLPSISKTLTDLELVLVMDVQDPANASLASILSICRHLDVIKYHTVMSPELCFSGLSLPFSTSLTKIDLASWKSPMRSSDLEPLLQCSSELRYLRLQHCEVDLLPMITQHCPKLTVLIMNDYEIEHSPPHIGYPPYPSKPGLRYLMLAGVSSSAESILSFLGSNHDTLETVFIAPMMNNSHVTTTTLVNSPCVPTSFTMPNLTFLYIKDENRVLRDALPTILRASPNLESLTLTKHLDGIRDEIFDAIGDLARLSHLNLTRCKFLPTNFGFAILASKFAAIRFHRFYELEIYHCPGSTADALKSIAQIKSMRKLSVYGVDDHVTGTDMVDLARLLGDLPRLESLMFSKLRVFPAAAVRALLKSDSLRSIEFYHVDGLTIESIDLLHTRTPPLDVVVYPK